MKEKIRIATHMGELKLADRIIPAAVLEDGTRVLSERGVSRALESKRGGAHWQRKKKALEEGGGAFLPVFISAGNLKPYIDSDLELALSSPITYKAGSGIANGVDATNLPKICDVWLKARDAGVLTEPQKRIATAADMLIRGLAHVGIIALVDEATGYQEIRDKRALEAILDRYLRKEFAEWAKRFPDEFYQEMFRLRGWQWRGMKVNRPSVVGKYTNDLVYNRLAPGILEELERRNPKGEKGHRKGKHHQLLTEDLGVPALGQHLFATVSFMRASATWDQFYRNMQRAFPKLNSNLYLNFPEPDEDQAST